MGLLQKIAWKTRRWNLKINLFDIYLHDGDGCWGFTLFEVVKDFIPHALLSLEFRLPNGGNVKRFTIDNWDFLFISTPFFRWASDLEESIMWGHKPSWTESLLLKVANKLYK